MGVLRTAWFTALGGAAVIAGADKITGDRGYMRMFRHLGWSRGAMRTVAAAEIVGGALIGLPATRALGGAVVAATSATVLVSELRRGDMRLAGPRAAVLLAALTAVAARRR